MARSAVNKPKQTPIQLSALCVAAVFAAGTNGSAAAAGDAQRGKELAVVWCSSCHLVSAEQQAAGTEAPPFKTIADRSPGEFSWLETFLADPHPPMPQLSLSRDEIRDLVAYIASLKEN